MLQKSVRYVCASVLALTLANAASAQDMSAQSSSTNDAAANNEDILLPPVNVRSASDAVDGTDTVGFTGSSSRTLTRTDTPLSQIPSTVNVVTQEVIHSQNSDSLFELLKNVSNVQTSVAGYGNGAVIIRGDRSDTGLTNGYSNATLTTAPIANIDHVEVLKGPASILTGAQVQGGTINIVLKKPTTDPIHELEFGVGSNQWYRLLGDFGGPLSDDKRFTYRLTAQSEYADHTYGGFRNTYRRMVNPSLGFNNGNTSIVVGLEYYANRLAPSPYAVALEDGSIARPGNTFFGDKRQRTNEHSLRAYYELEQTIAGSGDGEWKLRIRGQHQSDGQNTRVFTPSAAYSEYYPAPTLLITGVNNDSHDIQDAHHVDIYGKFKTGPLTHQLIIGGDYSRLRTRARLSASAFPFASFEADLADPGDLQIAPEPNSPYGVILTKQYGVFIQDQIDIGDNLHLLLAGRKSWYRGHSRQYNADLDSFFADNPDFSDFSSYQEVPTVLTETRTRANKFLPNVGAVYQLTSWLAAYASYNQGYTPIDDIATADGKPLTPIQTRQIEAGVKINLFDDMLFATASYFNTKTRNSPRLDPDNPIYYVSGPGRYARGAEIDVTGRLARGWNIIASYGYTKATEKAQLQNYDFEIGDVTFSDITLGAPGVSKHTGSLWSTYTVGNGALKGLGLALGGRITSSFKTVGTSSTTLYTVRGTRSVDAGLSYPAGPVKLNLTVNNLFNRLNYSRSEFYAYIPVEEKRSFRLTGRVSF